MSKPSRGTARFAAGKKKAKKRSESRPANHIAASAASTQPMQPEAPAHDTTGRTVLQFRPRPREAAPMRATAGRTAASARALQQVIDYSYVYADLKLIGGLSLLLFGGLVALSFVVR